MTCKSDITCRNKKLGDLNCHCTLLKFEVNVLPLVKLVLTLKLLV